MSLAGSPMVYHVWIHRWQVLGFGKCACFEDGQKWSQLALKFKMNCDHVLIKEAIRQTVFYYTTVYL